jgi:protein phosphatase 1G
LLLYWHAELTFHHPHGRRIKLEPDDEFIILGCDGIWDCLTNENAVKFVHERIDEKLTTEIGIEMLDTIISEDPRVTQGLGGDNMTIMVIDLQSASRKSRQTKNEPTPEDPADPAEPAE